LDKIRSLTKYHFTFLEVTSQKLDFASSGIISYVILGALGILS